MINTAIKCGFILCLLQSYFHSNAQGCSDAGFCTIGSLKHIAETDTAKEMKSRISLFAPFGLGDENVFVFTPALQYEYFASKTLTLAAKITANYATGNLGNAFGLGDIYVNATYVFPHKNKWNVQAVLGGKFFLNYSNINYQGRALPMQYQSSLGTIDAIVGLTVTNVTWAVLAGWQQPLTGRNRNYFLPVYWPTAEATKYPPTNDFKRKGDVLAKVGRNFAIGKKWVLNAGLLGILHLGKDEYIDANISNNPIAINGSEGVTLNITAAAYWNIGKHIRLGITGGAPVIVRKVRPDGLTRSFVLAPELSWGF